jgi:hypothetical protein
LELLVLIVFSSIVRLLFTLSPTSDTGMHLSFIQQEKLNNFGNHDMFNSLINGIQGYPKFPHRIVSFFPRKNWVFFGYILNIFWDILYLVSIYFISNYIILNTGIKINLINFSPGFVVAILTATSPILLPLTARIKSIGGRTFGNLVLLINLCVLYYIITYGFNIYLILLYGILLLIVVLSSQFALQAAIFFTIFISIYYQSYFILINMIILFISFYSFNIVGSRDILNQKINHWIWFFKNQEKGTVASNRNNFKDFFLLPYYFFYKKNKFLEIVFKKSSIFILIYSIPQLLILFLEWKVIEPFIQQNLLLEYIYVITLASIVVFIITSLKPFLFLGQAERYFEYTVFNINIFFLLLCILTNNIYFIIYVFLFHLIIIFIFFIYCNRASYIGTFKEVSNKNFLELLQYINNLRDKNIIVLPTKFAYETGKSINPENNIKFYYPFIAVKNKIDGMEYMEKDEQSLYHIKNDIEYFKQEYSITHIVLFKNELLEDCKKDYFESLRKYIIKFENENYIVYEVDND